MGPLGVDAVASVCEPHGAFRTACALAGAVEAGAGVAVGAGDGTAGTLGDAVAATAPDDALAVAPGVERAGVHVASMSATTAGRRSLPRSAHPLIPC